MGGRGVGWVFVRQLTLNAKGDLLITVAVGLRKRPVTFLINTGAQITALMQTEAEWHSISIPSRNLIVLTALGKMQLMPMASVVLWLPGEEAPSVLRCL